MKRLLGSVLGSAVLGAAVAAVAWAIGVTLLQCAFIALCVIAFAPARGVIEFQQIVSAGDQWRGRWTLTREGSRRDVRQLGWRMRADRGRVHGAALQRLRHVARRRLHRHGIDLDDPARAPAAEALLGPTAYRVLTAGDGRAVRYAAFVQTVAALERLGNPATPATPATHATPVATSIPEPR